MAQFSYSSFIFFFISTSSQEKNKIILFAPSSCIFTALGCMHFFFEIHLFYKNIIKFYRIWYFHHHHVTECNNVNNKKFSPSENLCFVYVACVNLMTYCNRWRLPFCCLNTPLSFSLLRQFVLTLRWKTTLEGSSASCGYLWMLWISTPS